MPLLISGKRVTRNNEKKGTEKRGVPEKSGYTGRKLQRIKEAMRRNFNKYGGGAPREGICERRAGL